MGSWLPTVKTWVVCQHQCRTSHAVIILALKTPALPNAHSYHVQPMCVCSDITSPTLLCICFEYLWAGVTSYIHIHGTHSSEGKRRQGKQDQRLNSNSGPTLYHGVSATRAMETSRDPSSPSLLCTSHRCAAIQRHLRPALTHLLMCILQLALWWWWWCLWLYIMM